METHHDAFHVTGGRPLRGELAVHSAKNSALYLILGALLTRERVVLREVPRLSDILAMCELLEHFGAHTRWEGRDLHLDAAELVTTDAPYALVSQLRASFVAMGALLGRCGEAHISMPGGCAFGPRPVDRHIRAFRQLGVDFAEVGGDFHAERRVPLAGRVVFDAPTVGGTQNVILASALGSERVVIENAALEPEIADLAEMLNLMGARIGGAGTPTVTIDGVERLSGVPTDLQAPFGAFLATVPGRSVVTDRVYPDRFTHVGELARTGAHLELRERTLVVQGGVLHGAPLHAADIRAGGALVIAALAARGHSTITGVQYVRRGYERLAERLAGLGAQIHLGAAPAGALGTGTYGD